MTHTDRKSAIDGYTRRQRYSTKARWISYPFLLPMRIALIRRQSPDWRAFGAHDMSEFDAFMGWSTGYTKHLNDLWDATVTTSFGQVRQQVKEISEACFRSVADIDVLVLDGNLDLLAAPENQDLIYLPTDDDDWFAPNIVAHLKLHPTSVGLVWPSVRFDGGWSIRKFFDPLLCFTNNYTFTHATNVGEPRPFSLLQHGGADHLYREGLRPYTTIEGYLSVTNKHPCTSGYLNKANHKPDPQAALKQTIRDYLLNAEHAIGQAEPLGLSWAVPYLRRSVEVFRSLAGDI